MMGQQSRTESLFYYFRLEEQIPTDHLLRMIDSYVDFSFVREQLKDFYSPTGRPSIDPEVLLRLLLVGYLYGITSERRLMDEVRMHLAYGWFTRLGFEQEISDHSTFSKNRHGRFRQSGVFRKVFEEIVRRCLEAGFVEGRNVAVDGTLVGANASQQSRVPRESLVEAAKLSRTVQEYLTELERQNPVAEEYDERQLNHSHGEAEKFYRDLKQRAGNVRVGMEATGHARWFERLAIQYYGCCVVDSYHEERNHQGKENLILFPLETEGARNGKAAVRCRERLGGLMKYYEREAA